jgi:hypothetical protein
VRLSKYKEPSGTVKEPPLRERVDLSDFDSEEKPVLANSPSQEFLPLCTIEQAVTFGASMKIGREACEFWWHTRNAAGWTRSSASGHARKITGWQSDLTISRAWAEEEAHKAKQAANGHNGKSRSLMGSDVGI